MKITCPNPDHDDQTPSAEVYPDGVYCFSCGYYEKGEYEVEEKKKEDIPEAISYINSLPKMSIRKLELPADGSGYYIVWPDGVYYKKRLFYGSVRYLGPAGHQAPLFTYKMGGQTLVLIEGELNAISLRQSLKSLEFTIASPGSCNEFMRHLLLYLIYNAIVIVCDKDPAGVAAGVELKRELMKHGKRVDLIACERDLNQILQDGGEEAVRKFWEDETLGMF